MRGVFRLFSIEFYDAGDCSLADRTEAFSRICFHTAVRIWPVYSLGLISRTLIDSNDRFRFGSSLDLFPYITLDRSWDLYDLWKHVVPFRLKIKEGRDVLFPRLAVRIIILNELIIVVILISKTCEAMTELMYHNRLEILMQSGSQSI